MKIAIKQINGTLVDWFEEHRERLELVKSLNELEEYLTRQLITSSSTAKLIAEVKAFEQGTDESAVHYLYRCQKVTSKIPALKTLAAFFILEGLRQDIRTEVEQKMLVAGSTTLEMEQLANYAIRSDDRAEGEI